MKINYHNKSFKVVQTSTNGDVSKNLIFTYQQKGFTLSCSYSSETILEGHLLGTVSSEGIISMHYHHIDDKKNIKTGLCTSTPELMKNGKIRLYEKWQWTNGDKTEGNSILEEI